MRIAFYLHTYVYVYIYRVTGHGNKVYVCKYCIRENHFNRNARNTPQKCKTIDKQGSFWTRSTLLLGFQVRETTWFKNLKDIDANRIYSRFIIHSFNSFCVINACFRVDFLIHVFANFDKISNYNIKIHISCIAKIEKTQVLLKKPAGRLHAGFFTGFSGKTGFFTEKVQFLGVNISDNATVKYATLKSCLKVKFLGFNVKIMSKKRLVYFINIPSN
jgi:hypothetical protein